MGLIHHGSDLDSDRDAAAVPAESPRPMWTATVPSLMWMRAGRAGKAAVAAPAADEPYGGAEIPGDVGRGSTMRVRGGTSRSTASATLPLYLRVPWATLSLW